MIAMTIYLPGYTKPWEKKIQLSCIKKFIIINFVLVTTAVEISIRHPIKLLIIFLLTAQIHLKICVCFLGLMGISIHIRFYNNFPPKNVINKTSFLRVEIIIKQFWKIAYLVYFSMAKEK